MDTEFPLRGLLLFLAFVPVSAVTTFFLISRRSGWFRLSQQYRYDTPFTGQQIPFRGARIGKARYKGALIFGVSEEGLYLVPIPPFRLFHPPLCIPWKDLEAKPVRLFFFSGYELTVRTMPDITIQVSVSSWQFMRKYL